MGGAGVESHCGNPFLFCYQAGFDECQVLLVDAPPKLHRHRDITGVAHCGADYRAEQVGLPWEGGPSPVSRHLAHRAAEVHVDVIDSEILDKQGNRLAECSRIGAVELNRSGHLVDIETSEGHRLLASLHKASGANHLRHIETRSEFAAEPAEGSVGHTGHRGQNHWRVDHNRADLEGHSLTRILEKALPGLLS